MNTLNNISNMNLTPITEYNKYLKNTAAFEVETGESNFENILSQQTAALQDSMKVQGGISLNNFDDVVAQQSVESASNGTSTGDFIKSFSKSLNSGLESVNEKVKAADKAQEAFAMGENISVHDVMIAAEKASLSMQMAMQLRTKLMTAYNEINNIRV